MDNLSSTDISNEVNRLLQDMIEKAKQPPDCIKQFIAKTYSTEEDEISKQLSIYSDEEIVAELDRREITHPPI
jgi:hypothetical protein